MTKDIRLVDPEKERNNESEIEWRGKIEEETV